MCVCLFVCVCSLAAFNYDYGHSDIWLLIFGSISLFFTKSIPLQFLGWFFYLFQNKSFWKSFKIHSNKNQPQCMNWFNTMHKSKWQKMKTNNFSHLMHFELNVNISISIHICISFELSMLTKLKSIPKWLNQISKYKILPYNFWSSDFDIHWTHL